MRSTMIKRLMVMMLAAGVLLGTFGASQAAYAQDSKQDSKGLPCPRQEHCGEKALRALLLHETAVQTQQSPRQVERELRQGHSLSEIAAAHGSTEQAVISAALGKLATRLDQAVANGRITAEQKAQIMTKARDRAPEIMNLRRQP